jgi:hypothetical protein
MRVGLELKVHKASLFLGFKGKYLCMYLLIMIQLWLFMYDCTKNVNSMFLAFIFLKLPIVQTSTYFLISSYVHNVLALYS